jgi:hypothetical protein
MIDFSYVHITINSASTQQGHPCSSASGSQHIVAHNRISCCGQKAMTTKEITMDEKCFNVAQIL